MNIKNIKLKREWVIAVVALLVGLGFGGRIDKALFYSTDYAAEIVDYYGTLPEKNRIKFRGGINRKTEHCDIAVYCVGDETKPNICDTAIKPENILLTPPINFP